MYGINDYQDLNLRTPIRARGPKAIVVNPYNLEWNFRDAQRQLYFCAINHIIVHLHKIRLRFSETTHVGGIRVS